MTAKKKSKKKAPKKAKVPTFEEGLEEIEKHIARLESGELSLEDSIGAYEKAMGSLKSCYALLNQAEGKIAMLTKAAQDSTEGGDYDVESGGAGPSHELAVDPDADTIEAADDDQIDDDYADEDDEESGGQLPF